MAQVSINIPVENIAGMINSMDVKEIETLCLLLNDEGQGSGNKGFQISVKG